MIRVDKECAIILHEMVFEASGGDIGVRDEGLLESALMSPYQTFDGEELYPDVIEKGARLGFALIRNHAFVDGNKRIGVLIMLAFLRANGVRLELSSDDVVRIGLGVADGSMGAQELSLMLRHAQKTN